MPGCCCTVQPRNAFFSLGVTGEPRYIPDLGTRSGTRTTSRHFGVLPLQPHRTALPPPDIASPRRPPLRASYRAAPPGFALLGAGAGGGDGGAAHGAGFIARPQRRPQPGGAAALTELRAAPRGTAAQRRGLTANRPTSPGGPRSEPGGAERRGERRGEERRRDGGGVRAAGGSAAGESGSAAAEVSAGRGERGAALQGGSPGVRSAPRAVGRAVLLAVAPLPFSSSALLLLFLSSLFFPLALPPPPSFFILFVFQLNPSAVRSANSLPASTGEFMNVHKGEQRFPGGCRHNAPIELRPRRRASLRGEKLGASAEPPRPRELGGVAASAYTPPPPAAAVQRAEDVRCTLVQGGLSVLY